MSERAPSQETAVQEAFGRFVVEHAEKALLWFVMPKDDETRQTFIEYVEFETDKYNRYEVPYDESDEDDGFCLEIFTNPGIILNGVMVLHDDGQLIVNDFSNELNVILDDPVADEPENELKSAVRLVEHITQLEKDGYLVPACDRQYEF